MAEPGMAPPATFDVEGASPQEPGAPPPMEKPAEPGMAPPSATYTEDIGPVGGAVRAKHGSAPRGRASPKRAYFSRALLASPFNVKMCWELPVL